MSGNSSLILRINRLLEMSTYLKTFLFCLVFTIAACGGGGGGSSDLATVQPVSEQPEPAPEPEPEPPTGNDVSTSENATQTAVDASSAQQNASSESFQTTAAVESVQASEALSEQFSASTSVQLIF